MPGKNSAAGSPVLPRLLERSLKLRDQRTPAEYKLWQRLRASRLEGWHFRSQQVLDGFTVDFYCQAADLVVEVSCSIHLQQSDCYRTRDEQLTARGLKVLRFESSRVETEIEAVLAEILEACKDNLVEGERQAPP